MALEQHAKGSFDDLNDYDEQQLRSILNEALDSEDIDYELIKRITNVLDAKTNAEPIDTEAAYQQFMAQYAKTDPLYNEVGEAFEASKNNESMSEIKEDMERAMKEPGKVIHFSRMVKLGILVAATLVLFFAVSVVASAMGFDIWHASVHWDKDNMGVSSAEGKPVGVDEDPYSRLRLAMKDEGIQELVVPTYMTDGYSLIDFCSNDSVEGHSYDVAYQKEGNSIVFSYHVAPKEYNAFYPKDGPEPEIYTVCGVDHYLTLNEGYYRAVWSNGEVVCELYGLDSKEELLKIINSIYKE